MTATKTRSAAAREAEEQLLRHYTAKETAALLGVSLSWVMHRAAERSIPCTYIARKLRFTAEHIRAISSAGEVKPSTRATAGV